jgi:hypothetical protein
MTLQDKICEAGVNTLAEFICEPCSGGSGETVYVDHHSIELIEEVSIIEMIEDIALLETIDDSSTLESADNTSNIETIEEIGIIQTIEEII